MIIIKSDPEVDLMRQAGRITAGARTVARQMVEPGVTTRQINQRSAQVHHEVRRVAVLHDRRWLPDGGMHLRQ